MRNEVLFKGLDFNLVIPTLWRDLPVRNCSTIKKLKTDKVDPSIASLQRDDKGRFFKHLNDSISNRYFKYAHFLLTCLLLGLASGCAEDPDWLFQPVDASYTGIDFVNFIVTDDTLYNSYDFFYVYNGGGVGVGDVNNDGLPDLYFTGNMVNNALYLNRGDFRFEEVTVQANVETSDTWSTGVSMVDINQDGLLDIYVSVGGPDPTAIRANKLYVNQGVDANGIPTFDEEAERYGIAAPNYSTHAAFLDYDLDGDLDLFVLDTAMRTQWGMRDRLYRNNAISPLEAEEQDLPPFTEVTEEAGIWFEGFGLGVAVSDINQDGWPDIYVANDFISKDLFYINNGDGTFSDRSSQHIKHQSYSAMGVDIADFNNDALLDIMVLDMLPPDPVRRRLITHEGGRHRGELEYGRNTLQLNRGETPQGIVAFSEIGQLAGVDATDWSWAPLFADFDNDGDRDLFVSNGYGEFVTHLDFEKLKNRRNFSGTPEEFRQEIFDFMSDLPDLKLPNHFFENDGDLTFEDRTGVWGSDQPGLSNGAAMVDLDQDGDLDLVTNNINEPSSIFRNTTRERGGGYSLRVKLHGAAGNSSGLGAKVILYKEGGLQYHDHSLYRGFQSTVEPVIHFGLGADSTADSLKVFWPDGVSQTLTQLQANNPVEVYHEHAVENNSVRSVLGIGSSEQSLVFSDMSGKEGLNYDHVEFGVIEYDKAPLLPHKFSLGGPGLSVGDVDGNGLDDVFIGSDPGRDRRLFLQTESGKFERKLQSWDNRYEDMGSLFFDAEGDGDMDLYVVSGGNFAPPQSEVYQDRLYLNDGSGGLTLAPEALPDLTASGSSVSAADYDADGDLDLFVAGRLQPENYPLAPRSYILRNESTEDSARFVDITKDIAPELAEVGLVTSALWTDFNGDDDIDLVVVGEWMPIRFFQNISGQFTDVTEEVGLQNSSGWWNSIVSGDFDRDGDMDYVAGNLGLNSRYHASVDEPARIYVKDFDNDGRIDPVMTHYQQGIPYATHSRDEMTRQIIGMIRRFPTYQAYGEVPFSGVFAEQELDGAYIADARSFETSYLENRGDGTFDIGALPIEVQMAPVFGMKVGYYDADEFLDLLLVGNWYAPNTETGRLDAFYGALLQGDGAGGFTYLSYAESGFVVPGDARGLVELTTGNDSSLILSTQNNGPLKAFSPQAREAFPVSLQPLDRFALLKFQDGHIQKMEASFGSTYLSQSSRTLWVPDNVQEVQVVDSRGNSRVVLRE